MKKANHPDVEADKKLFKNMLSKAVNKVKVSRVATAMKKQAMAKKKSK